MKKENYKKLYSSCFKELKSYKMMVIDDSRDRIDRAKEIQKLKKEISGLNKKLNVINQMVNTILNLTEEDDKLKER